jgi:hypothetical protein
MAVFATSPVDCCCCRLIFVVAVDLSLLVTVVVVVHDGTMAGCAVLLSQSQAMASWSDTKDDERKTEIVTLRLCYDTTVETVQARYTPSLDAVCPQWQSSPQCPSLIAVSKA